MATKKNEDVNKDNIITKALIWVLGDAGRSKRVRMTLVGLLGTGLTALSTKYGWIDAGYSEKIVDMLFWGTTIFVGGQSGIDMLSGGKTSANAK